MEKQQTINPEDWERLSELTAWLLALIRGINKDDDILTSDEWIRFNYVYDEYKNLIKKYEVLNGNKTSK